jgi:hypothetical protein
MSINRIRQGVIHVTFEDGRKPFLRVSRSYISTLANYWRSQTGFKYLKIYDIIDYKRGKQHKLSKQTGFITLKGSKYDSNGINESFASEEYKIRKRL